MVSEVPFSEAATRAFIKTCATFTGKHLCLSLKACNFTKKRFQSSSFPVNIAKFLSVCMRVCVCVCVCVCVYFLRLLLTEKNKCNARDQASNVALRK